MSASWHNWSGSVAVQPARIEAPRSEDELASILRESVRVRAVGAGHSFVPLCATEGTLLDLSRLDSQIELADDRKSAWVPAGWSLKRITAALWELGFSLPNQGDVNPQSLAGAIATGTHGTGEQLGSLSTFARAFRLLLADGAPVECSAHEQPRLFEAQRLSLGLLGIATRIRIDVLPAFRLEERIERMRFDECAERFATLARDHRHVEFFVFPYADEVILKTLQPTEDDPPFREPRPNSEEPFRKYCDLCATLPFLTGFMQRQVMKTIRSARRVGPAYRVFPSERTVRFEEMEYELPRAAGFPVLREVIEWIRRRKSALIFPFEFRWTAQDDIWLSPFNHGPCASISIHQYSKRPWDALFREVEPIFRSHGGRPHWAKRHTLTSREVFELYPQAREFCEVRAQIDPQGKFVNAHLSNLFELNPRS
ncbi:MAG TPA: D-arabinono-1,4-lactone oxidase [Polyangiales bacterium]